ncbi:MAG TPA: DUF4337 domain-containing protein [Gemmatimonadaceae bacterium]|jgi:hypothetical protein
MGVDLLEAADSGDGGDGHDNGHSLLNTRVAITVALLATFMGICKVKDDNIVQAMQQAQADKIDHWAFYQARNIRQDVAQSELTTLTIQRRAAAPANRAAVDSGITRYQSLVKDQATKKDSLRVQAEQDQKAYDSLNYRDDQFDLSDALLALAISLLAVTSLTKKEWLFWIAMVPTVFGALMGVAGLFGWMIHPDSISRMLS